MEKAQSYLQDRMRSLGHLSEDYLNLNFGTQ